MSGILPLAFADAQDNILDMEVLSLHNLVWQALSEGDTVRAHSYLVSEFNRLFSLGRCDVLLRLLRAYGDVLLEVSTEVQCQANTYLLMCVVDTLSSPGLALSYWRRDCPLDSVRARVLAYMLTVTGSYSAFVKVEEYLKKFIEPVKVRQLATVTLLTATLNEGRLPILYKLLPGGAVLYVNRGLRAVGLDARARYSFLQLVAVCAVPASYILTRSVTMTMWALAGYLLVRDAMRRQLHTILHHTTLYIIRTSHGT